MRKRERPHKGVFITFEGVDGSGKTTQLRALGVWLRQQGAKVVETREPGGTPIAERIRDVLMDPENTGLALRAELFLMLASRAEHVENTILPALEAGQTVLCDRFADATIAYQGGGRDLPMELLGQVNKFATGGLNPDVTFLLDVDPSVGRKRLGGRPTDRFTLEPPAFYTRVREGYQRIAERDRERVVPVGPTGSLAVIQEKIRREVTRRELVVA